MNNSKARILVWLMAITLLMTGTIFASGVKMQVIFQDGLTSGVVELISLDDGVFLVKDSSGLNRIPLHTIGAIYFIGSASQRSPGLTVPRSYLLGGSVYTLGAEDGVFAAYGPTGIRITDPKFLQDLKNLDVATEMLRDTNLPNRLDDYLKIILSKISYSWIQRNLAGIRDLAVGIVANAVATLFTTATPVELAYRVGVDLTQDAIKDLMDPEKYLYSLAAGNLIYLRTEMEKLKEMIRQIPTSDSQVRDGDHLLEAIGKYFMIFTLYQPTMNLLDALTPSGALDDQFKAVGQVIASKFASELSPATGIALTIHSIDEQIRSGFAQYDQYHREIQQIHANLKTIMPFLDEGTTAVKEYLGFFVVQYGTKVVNAPTPEQRAQQYQSVQQILHSTMPLPPSLQNPFMTPSRLPDLMRPPVRREEPGMVLVHGGAFQRGNTRNDSEGRDNEKPVHTVTLTYDYWIGKYEVTFDEYDAFCEATGRSKPKDEGWTRGLRPVINVSWIDAIAYCNWLSERQGLPKAYDRSGNLLDAQGRITVDLRQVYGYRLPTEAEWEYAARGGHASTTDYKYAGSNNLDEVGFYTDNSGLHGFKSTQEVGKKLPNELGLYDMSGNVWEWCHDWWGNYLPEHQENPVGPTSGSRRVLRGGSWLSSAASCRVAFRGNGSPGDSRSNRGFRIARTAP